MNHGRGRNAACTPEMRFWGQVDKSEGPHACWSWTGARHFRGYGACAKSYGDTRAHRVAYMLAKGEIPEGLGVLHHCDNTICVNPAHLYLGDQKVNMADCVARGRKGHAYIPLDQLLHPQLSKRLKGG